MSGKAIDLVLSGSGTNATCLQGAMTALLDRGYKIKRIAGTSGGSIVAAAIAYGMSNRQMIDITNELFGEGLLDRSVFALRRGGIHRGNRIHHLLRKYFPGKMSKRKLPWGAFATNLNERRPYFFSSEPTKARDPVEAVCDPRVNSADVLRASISIPFFFAAAKIPQYPKTFWSDGGVTVNHGMGVFDDNPRPTVGARFHESHKARPIYGTVGVVKANIAVLLGNISHTYVSRKRYNSVIEIKTKSDSLNFAKNKKEVQVMFDEGYSAAKKWIQEQAIG